MTNPLPPWFTDRDDDRPDTEFYATPRLVTHIDDAAIAAVGDLYADLGLDGSSPTPQRVLDLMSSWVSHLHSAPSELVVLGLNAVELDANPMATERVVHDLNADPRIPLPDDDVDAALCCVSIDYLTRPVEVLRDLARVLRPGGRIALFELDYAAMVLGGDPKFADDVLAVVCGTVSCDRMGRSLGPLLTAAGLRVVEQVPVALPIPPPVWAAAVRAPVDDAVTDGRLDPERTDRWLAELAAPGAWPGSVTGVLACGV